LAHEHRTPTRPGVRLVPDRPASQPDSYDPFDDFNRAQGQGQVRDPYPMLAGMRRACPVHEIDLRAVLGEKELVPGLAPIIYSVLDHAFVSRVLRDGRLFSSRCYAASMGPVMGHTILEMDEPEHSRYRALIQKAFTRQALERWEHELVHPIVHGLIDRFAGRGHADLVRELTFPFPVAVIAGMMGLPPESRDEFHRLAVELISINVDRERGVVASGKLRRLYARVLAERRAEPRDDLISLLAGAELDGHRLSDDEIFSFLLLLAPAGAETTYRSSSNLFCGLLMKPEQLEAVRRDRSLVPQATEEGLRWECPLTSIMRVTTEEVELAGVRIPAGGVISVNLGAANRDESRYPSPDVFDIFREPRQHMAFAFGAHRCLGMHLARMETRVVLEAVLDRLPNVRLDPRAQDVHVTGMIFRSPLELPVVFEPS
jgi:cytochrome P450